MTFTCIILILTTYRTVDVNPSGLLFCQLAEHTVSKKLVFMLKTSVSSTSQTRISLLKNIKDIKLNSDKKIYPHHMVGSPEF